MDGPQCLSCIRSEIHNVLSTMRRNGRWASDERFVREIPSDFENPLIRSLKSLHDYLQPFEDVNDVDAVAYLEPFLEVVAFPNTNGAMTGRALSSINKFLLYGAVTQESPRGREAINLAVASVVECKFEGKCLLGVSDRSGWSRGHICLCGSDTVRLWCVLVAAASHSIFSHHSDSCSHQLLQ